MSFSLMNPALIWISQMGAVGFGVELENVIQMQQLTNMIDMVVEG